MEKMAYKDQLLDRRWQMKKNKILERDKYTCQNTNCQHKEDNSKQLHVHHLDYFPDLMAWEYPDDMLTTLCEPCHTKESFRPKEEKYLINTLRMNGFLSSDLLAYSSLIETDEVFAKRLLNLIREFQSK